MSLSDRARSWADWLTGSGVERRGAALLFECAAALEAKDAEIAALREAVGALPGYAPWKTYSQLAPANAALRAARKLAGGEP